MIFVLLAIFVIIFIYICLKIGDDKKMNDRQSIIYLCDGIKLDKTYKNVIFYTQSEMVNLCDQNKIGYRNNYSFIKHGLNKIRVDFPYSDCLRANYIAFQNYEYSNKWFFAFIDSVEYVSDGTTIINFTVDVFSTWFRNVTVKRCFVEREHVNDDTLGKHTIPEGLECGEYMVNEYGTDNVNSDVTIVTGTLITPSEVSLSGTPLRCNKYNGIPTPLVYCRWDSLSELTTFLNDLSSRGKVDYLISMFLAPKWLCPLWDSSVDTHIIDGIEDGSSSGTDVYSVGFDFSRITTLDGYQPHNNKLLCYPYCYIGVSNSVGQYSIYRQENWTLQPNDKMRMLIYGSLTSGCSIKAIPVGYNKKIGTYLDESISLGKFPTLAWANDLYTNWQTQNGVNILGLELSNTESSLLGSVSKSLIGVNSNNFEQIGSGIGDIFEEMKQTYRSTLTPLGVRGSLNTADVLNGINENCFYYYKMTIKEEYAKIIDSYFDKFGYKVNELKYPNLSGRKYWNYVKIGGSEVIGYGNIPADAMSTINKIMRNGTTIWHNHSNIGDYNLENTII